MKIRDQKPENADFEILEDGVIELRVFHVEMGQGALTVDAQAVSEEFRIPMDKIKVVFGDSQYCPYDEGAYCSRGTFLNGNAIILACANLKEKLFSIAAKHLNVAPEELDTAAGIVFEKNNPDNKIAFEGLFNYGGWIEGGELIGTDTYIAPWGTDDPETGQSDDIFIFYSHGEQGKVINANFRDYRIPTFMDSKVDKGYDCGFVGVPHKLGPHGAKGVGEVAMIPIMPGITNAINDALGVELNQLPITPERVLRGILSVEGKEL